MPEILNDNQVHEIGSFEVPVHTAALGVMISFKHVGLNFLKLFQGSFNSSH